MINAELSQIRISEHAIHFVFDSQESIDGYDDIKFVDVSGLVVGSVNLSETVPAIVPFKEFVGRTLKEIQRESGRLTLKFSGGAKVILCRKHSQHEIGLIASEDGVEEVH